MCFGPVGTEAPQPRTRSFRTTLGEKKLRMHNHMMSMTLVQPREARKTNIRPRNRETWFPWAQGKYCKSTGRRNSCTEAGTDRVPELIFLFFSGPIERCSVVSAPGASGHRPSHLLGCTRGVRPRSPDLAFIAPPPPLAPHPNLGSCK